MNEDREQRIDGQPDSGSEVWIAGTKLDGGGYQVKVDGFYSGRNTDVGEADTIAQQPGSMGDDTAGEEAPNGGTNGVLAPAPTKPLRDERGRLLPGYSGNPTGRTNADRAMARAIHAEYSPDRVVSMLQDTWDSAAGRNSWRGMLEVTRLVIEYTIGKPVARSITVSSKAESMIERLERIQLGAEGEEQ